MRHIGTVFRRPAAVLVTLVAATDVAYRLLLRPALRRGLGIRD
jgi:hypothetical protein